MTNASISRWLVSTLLLTVLPIAGLRAQDCGCKAGGYVTPETALDSLEHLTKGRYTFIVVNDENRFGRNGQRKGAQTLGDVAEATGAEFIVSNGDTFHYLGVASVQDPVFKTGFEDIYTHPETQIPWYFTLGNHEHRSNGQALIDYSKISARWNMPYFYYKIDVRDPDGVSADLFLIDTPSLIDKYRDNPEEYPQSSLLDREEQLRWLDTELAKSTADFKIVLGHHPIFAETSKDESECLDMQKYVLPLLQKYGVDLYFSGHIHNFQVIKKPGNKTVFVTNSTISKTRDVSPVDGTVFALNSQGMTVVSISQETCDVYLVDNNAHILYRERLSH